MKKLSRFLALLLTVMVVTACFLSPQTAVACDLCDNNDHDPWKDLFDFGVPGDEPTNPGGSDPGWTGGGTGSVEPDPGAANQTPSTAPGSGGVSATGQITVLVNGAAIAFDQSPVVERGVTLVPMRAIFEVLGAEVEWDSVTQTVIARKDGTTVLLRIGSNLLFINGEIVELDVPARKIGGRTLVPVRAIAESFGAEVGWNQSTRTVMIWNY